MRMRFMYDKMEIDGTVCAWKRENTVAGVGSGGAAGYFGEEDNKGLEDTLRYGACCNSGDDVGETGDAGVYVLWSLATVICCRSDATIRTVSFTGKVSKSMLRADGKGREVGL